MMSVRILFCLLFAFGCLGAIKDHLITNLPNFSGALGKQYSGYIEIDSKNGKYMHYWFVESARNPAKDPVVLWLNGGPGCSSLDGYFYEQGPIHFDPKINSTDLISNPWAWSKVANVIFLEAPVGVGFSYSNTPSDYNTNDNKTADDNAAFVQQWLKSYPEFSKQPFWITGESYAGVYVPTLSYRVMAFHKYFAGMMVGNGCTSAGCQEFDTSLAPFAYGHALISKELYDYAEANCRPAHYNEKNCQQAQNEVWKQYDDIMIYDIYTPCKHQRPVRWNRPGITTQVDDLANHIPSTSVNFKEGMSDGGPSCEAGEKATAYLNKHNVKQSIHVMESIHWDLCSNKLNYQGETKTVGPYYKALIAAKKKILVYSGDVDSCVPFTGTVDWIENVMGWKPKESWKVWYKPSELYGRQVGGYYSTYSGLTFMTVKGSGHMVPQFQPESAYYMFSRFVEGKTP